MYKSPNERPPSQYVNVYSGGSVRCHPTRVDNALKSKNEWKKFHKEFEMCVVLADNGYVVELLAEVPGCSSADIRLDGTLAELKSPHTAINISRYGRDAIRRQGAKLIVFEFKKLSSQVLKQLRTLTTMYHIHGLYFTTKKRIVYTF